jgi:hypothetical protein
MDQTWHPSDTYPGITQERLLVVGDLIRTVREEAADDHHPEKFETNWTLGVSGYERTCGQLSWAQQSYPWLEVPCGAAGGPVHFVFKIGGHPMRFYRGDPGEIPTRYQQLSFPELVEIQKARAVDSGLPEGVGLRMSVDLDADGRPTNIYLVEMDERTGEPLNIYLIPFMAKTTNIVEFTPLVAPVEIPPVSAEPIDSEQEGNKNKTGSNDE